MNEIFKRVDAAKHVVVVAHVNPDADSLGSASAFYTHMLRLHKKVSFFCATKEIDAKLSCIPWFEKVKNSFPTSADLAICFDCGERSRLGVEVDCTLINIDHHHQNTHFAEINLVQESISTTLLLYNFFLENNISINPKMATALYAGLLDDSDGFLSDEVDGIVFAAVSELIELGANYKECNNSLMKRISLGAFRLKGIMHSKMRLHSQGRLAFFCISAEELKAAGALCRDCESVLEEALYLPSVGVSVLLCQNSDLSIKGSIRSNTQLDASKIAKSFLGGGHKSRAGFHVKEPLSMQEIEEKILKLINEEI